MGDDVLAAVRLRSGKVNWREVGRLEQADRTGRPLLKSKRLALDHLHEHGPLCVARAAQAEHERQTAWTRALGYRVETSRTQNGVHTTTVTGGELATTGCAPGARRRAREHRPVRTRRASSSSSTSSDDPGEPEPPCTGATRRGDLRHISYGIAAFLAEVRP